MDHIRLDVGDVESLIEKLTGLCLILHVFGRIAASFDPAPRADLDKDIPVTVKTDQRMASFAEIWQPAHESFIDE
jgi:hypothetical protein